MYKIVAGKCVVHDESLRHTGYLALSGTLTLEINKAGLLTFKLPTVNEAYCHGALVPLSNRIYVYQDNKQIWSGRVMELKQELNGLVNVTCEGWLNSLNDTLILPDEFPASGPIPTVLSNIVSVHNTRTDLEKRISSKCVGYDNANIDVSNIEQKPYTCTELIRTLFVSNPELDCRISMEEGDVLVLINRLTDHVINQDLIQDDNLIDFSANVDGTKIFSIIYPVGANGLTLQEKYVQNDALIIGFGRIYRVVNFPDIDDETDLREAAESFLETVTENAGISLTAKDLSEKSSYRFEKISIGRYVRVFSSDFGIEKDLMCSKIRIDIRDPMKNRYYLGNPEDRISFTEELSRRRISTSRKRLVNLHSDTVPISFYG